MKPASQEVKEKMEAARKIARLEKENEELKKANLILKEVASFFSKDRPESDSGRSERSRRKKKSR